MLSNIGEVQEILPAFGGFKIITHWRILILLFLAIILPLLLIVYRDQIPLRKKYKVLLSSILGICLICEIIPNYKFLQLFLQHKDIQKVEGLIFRRYHEEVPTPLHRFAFSCYSLNQSSRFFENIKRSTLSAQIDSCSYVSPHIVLIIGESYNKYHSTLYGYKLETTPLQKMHQDEGNLQVFNNVVTPWNITSNVFLDIFSMWEYGIEKSIEDIPLFPILFQRAGYSVNFFSNQFLLQGLGKGATNQLGHFFLADREFSDSLFTFRNRHACNFDMELVDQVAEFNNQQGSCHYVLDIIHLRGQHFDYSMRYPQSKTKFYIDDYAYRNNKIEEKEILAQYDNATYYNDMVLDSILQIYSNKESIVIFIADHGEEVYDDLPIHGRLFKEPIAKQAQYEYEVPMWIWYSDSYQQKHPDITNNIKRSVNKQFMIDGLPQILLSLAGISCCWTVETRNLLSRKYKNRQRIIGGNKDYDELISGVN